jgi:hypothetical protein
MKVFLSWSGEVSHKVASALHQWLPYMIQPVKPFLSSVDISKGERWRDVLSQELKDAKYGIVCVTAHNVEKPWMNFEAGMLSNFFERSCLTPLLFRVNSSDVVGPLGQFQSAVCEKSDVLNLIHSINYQLGPNQLDHEVLRRTFEIWWKELEKELNKIPLTVMNETQTNYTWLYVREDLPLHDLKATESLWIVTSSPFDHATSENTQKLVMENVSRGVKYRYFFPDNAERDRPVREQLEEMKRSSNGQLEYHFFEKGHFDKLVASDYIIINPETGADGNLRRMFLKLPIQEKKHEPVGQGSAGEKEFWITVDERSTVSFVDRFSDLWPKGHLSKGVSGGQ